MYLIRPFFVLFAHILSGVSYHNALAGIADALAGKVVGGGDLRETILHLRNINAAHLQVANIDFFQAGAAREYTAHTCQTVSIEVFNALYGRQSGQPLKPRTCRCRLGLCERLVKGNSCNSGISPRRGSSGSLDFILLRWRASCVQGKQPLVPVVYNVHTLPVRESHGAWLSVVICGNAYNRVSL